MTKTLLKTFFVLLTAATLMPFSAQADDVIINETNFPDTNFRNYLLSQNYGADGKLTNAEINNITFITVDSKNISSLKGIEFFTALIYLSCENNQLTALDVSKNTALYYLLCRINQLTALDVSKNTALGSLYCNNNRLTALNLSANTALTDLGCNSNKLSILDMSKNTALKNLYCNNNQLSILDISKNTALTSLRCFSNQIKEEGMEILVNSLPENNTDKPSTFLVFDSTDANEGNVMTKGQVAKAKEKVGCRNIKAAKAKGWTAYYFDGAEWLEYEGVDAPDGIEGIKADGAEKADRADGGTAPVYRANGQRLPKPMKGLNIIGGKKVMVK